MLFFGMRRVMGDAFFLDEARRAVRQLPPQHPLKVTLQLFIKHAVGRDNAIPWPKLRALLIKNGIQIEKRAFQQRIVKSTRATNVFIASSKKGYFLIADEHDAEEMSRFYRDRIAAERHHLTRLQRLAKARGWSIA